ncbi:response regulator [bacterium]|nr:response regulator [bacterium]
MSKKILVVEDERALAKVLKLKLEKSGFEIFNAFNGQEALDIVKKQKIDLILLDLVMPKMDGFGFLEEFSKLKKKKVKVIITSNLSQDDDIKKAKDLGVLDFLVKSNISIADIIKKVKKIVG